MRTDAGYPEDELDEAEAWGRATQCVGQKGYSFVFNNCEHFVTRILKNESRCTQVGNALRKGTSASTGSATLTSASILTCL